MGGNQSQKKEYFLSDSITVDYKINDALFEQKNKFYLISRCHDNLLSFYGYTNEKKFRLLNKKKIRLIHETKINECRGICIQPFTDHLLVCSGFEKRLNVLKIDNSNKNEIISTNLYSIDMGSNLNDACCQRDGHITTANCEVVKLFDASGKFLSHLKNQHHPGFLVAHGVCYLHSFSSPLLLVVDRNKKFSVWDHYQMQHQQVADIDINGFPNRVYADVYGNVCVSCSDDYNSRIEIREPRMNFKTLQNIYNFQTPIGLNADEYNRLMVMDHGKNQIKFFDYY